MIAVHERAFADPRFVALGHELRCSPGEAAWRCLGLWSHGRGQERPRLRPALVAAGLRCRRERVAELVVEMDIGAVIDGGEIEIRFDGVFGSGVDAHEEPAQVAEHADRNLEAEAVSAIGLVGPISRQRLRGRLQCRKASLVEVVRRLIERGVAIDTPAGLMLALATTVDEDGAAAANPVPAHVPGRSVEHPDPFPDPFRGTGRGNSSLSDSSGSQIIEITSKVREREPTTRATADRSREHPAECPSEQGRRAQSLWEYWDSRAMEVLGERWRSPGPVAGPYRVLQALGHPELRARTEAEIRHGLDMLVAEAREKMVQGDPDPGRWLSTWSPQVLSKACDVPDAAAARARVGGASAASRRGLRPSRSVAPTPVEVFSGGRGRGGAT